MIETYRGVVYPYQLDHMDHMNVQWYTSKFDEGTWHLFAMIGLTSDYFIKNNKGMAALEQTTKYKAELMAGNLVVIRSEILEVRDKTIRFFHSMENAETGVEAATTELIAAHLDRSLRKASPLPDNISEKCAGLMRVSN
ncbi:MAG: thioesterase family protein [Proteobacteria bacterium]|nr:thioesterase family protein [Pseudomonadota bacterium]